MFSMAAISIAAEEAGSEFSLSAKLETENAISKDPFTVKPGDIIEFVVSVDSNPGSLYSLEVRASFDNEALEFLGVSSEDYGVIFEKNDTATRTSVTAKEKANTDGLIQVWLMSNTGYDSNATGEFITLRFKVNESFDGDIENLDITYANYGIRGQRLTNYSVPATPVIKAHNYGEPKLLPGDCTTANKHEYTCPCGDVLVLDIDQPMGHTYKSVAEVPATCISTGVAKHYECSVCHKLFADVIGEDGVSNPGSEVNSEDLIIPEGGHDYVAVVTAPTCTDKGYTTHTCSRCQDTYTDSEVAALGHSFGDWVETTAPTCTDKGVNTKTCSVCGATETEDIAALGHKYLGVVTDPTCTEKGYVTYTCEVCSDSYKDKYVDALGHKFEDAGYPVRPTCTEDGVKKEVCSVCGEEKLTTAKALGHAPAEANQKDPTCTETGLTAGTYCTVCNEKLTQEVIPALGHDYVAVVTAPTCVDKGYTTHTCSRCQDTYTDSEVAALGHDFGEWQLTTAPTCTVKGVETRYCKVCNFSETQDVAELGHDYVAVVTAPTCLDKGYTTHTCSRCQDTYTDSEVAALGHDYVAVVTAPTCTDKGYTTHTCSRCQDTYTDSEVAALGHSFGEWVVTTEPTCLTEGVETKTCTVCQHAETQPVAALGHDYVAVVTAPTCLDKGYTTHTCSRCDDTYTDTEVDALGHDLGDWTLTTEPTCTAKGVETKYCSRCDYTETQDVAMLEHAWGDWVQTTAPTTTSAGENTSTCADCGATKTEPVSKLPVMTFTPEEWKKGEGLTFISDAEFENFVKVTINGEELAKEHYTVSEGSTVVVLNDEYLETLEAGEYTIAIESTTGTAEATFEIASNVWWIVLIVVAAVLLCGGGAVAVVIFLRKERNAA